MSHVCHKIHKRPFVLATCFAFKLIFTELQLTVIRGVVACDRLTEERRPMKLRVTILRPKESCESCMDGMRGIGLIIIIYIFFTAPTIYNKNACALQLYTVGAEVKP